MLASSCRKEKFTLSGDVTINSDTLWFDTVFTKASVQKPISVNKQILVYNPNNESIKTRITLGGGSTSHFRLNVDGESGHTFNEIEIFPNDSIFLFVEVHPDPNNNSPDFNPLIIRDSIIFNTNGEESKTMLIGWGQDAHYIFRDSIDVDTTWANDKLPIVVYDYFYVKPGAKLTIEKGMQVYFAPRSWLFIEGQLDMKGTKDEPIVMQGDRLQPDWEETPGQWGGIWISHPSYGNTIEHSLIKNGTVGVYCDSTPGLLGQSNVDIKKTMIRNMSFDGISGRRSTINVENSVSANCGRFTFFGDGGKYSILNSTFYTGGKDFGRQDPTFFYRNRTRDDLNPNIILETYDIEFTFINNIIDGVVLDGEIFGDIDVTKVTGPLSVRNNMLKTEDPFYSTAGFNNIINKDPKFIDEYNYNFDLDSLSPAKNAGEILNPVIIDDFYNRLRNTIDIGAFESQF
ncbi:MAG: hypothetical protein COA58_09365 [Bacteroidetes bacterium]|nr:MAG: hypothetical protein COA58_09365 [Bacteroidota bacterium]